MFAGLALLAACNSGARIMPLSYPATHFSALRPAATPSCAPRSACAYGVLVSDPQAKPLGGIRIAIAPWEDPGVAPRTVATSHADGTFSFHARPGRYLLVIGSDTAYTPPPGYKTPSPLQSPGTDRGITGMHWLATIHDKIELKRGNQDLLAPDLPRQPGNILKDPNSKIRIPPVERYGKYRLTTLTGVEAECLAIEQRRRKRHGRTALVPDEWLIENARAKNRSAIANNYAGHVKGQTTLNYPALRGGAAGNGGNSCAQFVDGFGRLILEERRARTAYYSGEYAFNTPNPHTGLSQGFFFEQWFPDPRTVSQFWP
jgi:hypothetical protein